MTHPTTKPTPAEHAQIEAELLKKYGRLCRCGHRKAAHEHLRPGHDCGACGKERCPRFEVAR